MKKGSEEYNLQSWNYSKRDMNNLQFNEVYEILAKYLSTCFLKPHTL